MRGLVFIGAMGGAAFYPEERRLVQELTLHFARVVYVYGIGIRGFRLDRLSELPRTIRRFRRTAVGHGPPTVASLKILPPRIAMQPINIRWLRHQLRNLMTDEIEEWVFWTRFPSPEIVAAIDGLTFARVVYEPIDRYAAHPAFSKGERARMIAAETRLAKTALVIASSQAVAKHLGGHWLPLAIEESKPSERPSAAAQIPTPRILVLGALDWRLDQALLSQVASDHPDWHFVLAGPVAINVQPGLALLPNVHWLGGIPPEQARGIIRDCDVTLIPYLLTDWTRACLPFKTFDYLAEGKPVVATPLPELEAFSQVVALATGSEFGEAIRRALNDSPAAAQQRRSIADQFTVEKRTARILELLA